MEDLLRPEGDEDGGGLGGEGAERLDFAQAIGQDSIQPVLLLPAQDAHLAEILAGHGENGFRIAVQLLPAVGQVYQGNQPEHHPLIPVG